MHTIKPRPESHPDFSLGAAILAPPALMGLLVLIGVGAAIAVCVTFVVVFAVTTTLDVRWLLRCRRANTEGRSGVRADGTGQ